jgi:hypothetical protein
MNVKPLTFALSVSAVLSTSFGIASASVANPGLDPGIQLTAAGPDRAQAAAQPIRMAAVKKKTKKRVAHNGPATNTFQNNNSGNPNPDTNHPIQPYLHGPIRQ